MSGRRYRRRQKGYGPERGRYRRRQKGYGPERGCYRKRQKGYGSSRQVGGFTPTIRKIMAHYDKTRPGWHQRKFRLNLPGRPGYTRKGQAGRGPKLNALKKGLKKVWKFLTPRIKKAARNQIPNLEKLVFAKPEDRKGIFKESLDKFGRDIFSGQTGSGYHHRRGGYKAVW